jgi:putative sterol carrier protein
MVCLSSARWRKSSFSMGSGNSLEVAFFDSGEIAVRDAKDGEAGYMLVFTPGEWQAFLNGAKAGEFDFGESGA